MADTDRMRWNQRYLQEKGPGDAPNRWLVDAAAWLASHEAAAAQQGRSPVALDIACGVGGAVHWLAARGWQATGVDLSDVALATARRQAHLLGVGVRCVFVCADLDHWRPLVDSVDLCTCFYFLDRALWPALMAAVRPGGLVIWRTFDRRRLAQRPATHPAHLLEPGEPAAYVQAAGWSLLRAEHDADGVTSGVIARKPATEG